MKPVKLESYAVQTGRYPIKVSLLKWPDSQPHIELYRGAPSNNGKYKHTNFSIYNQQTWEIIKRIIENKLLTKIKKGHNISKKILEEEAQKEIDRLLKDKGKLNEKLRTMRELIKLSRESNFKLYKETIKEFGALLDRAKKESDLQSFLTKNPWMLGLEYEHSTPQKIGLGARYDFYLENYTGYADIVEIKKHNDPIFDKKGKITNKFGKSLHQLIEYIDDANYSGDSKTISKKMNFKFLKPKGILIMGRKTDYEKLKNLNYYFHHIDVLTYDDVLERSNRIIESLSTKQKRKRK